MVIYHTGTSAGVAVGISLLVCRLFTPIKSYGKLAGLSWFFFNLYLELCGPIMKELDYNML